MRVVIVVLLLHSAVLAQDMKQGEQVFATTCSSTYCHGARGAGGGAPRISARGFDQAYITNIVTRGVPDTPMPAFGSTLSRQDLSAVIAYVGSLNGIAGAAGNSNATPLSSATLAPEAASGRDLFCDALRPFGRCSTCHEVNGIGIPVAPPISRVPEDVQALRNLPTLSVRTVKLGDRTMPALSISNGSRDVIFYDLTAAPPVLRTVGPGAATWRDGSDWRHASVIAKYNDKELASILIYLRAVAQR